MKKSLTALACAALFAVSLFTPMREVSAQTTPQFDSPAAAAAPKPHKKKVHAKTGAKVKAAKASKTKVAGKVKKTKKNKKIKTGKTKAKRTKAHKTL
ncbi:hypothetical protein MIZ03_0317 [Rhodoferax lithotrophicus]|uniref:Acid shock protein n=1 Tax=Rhodoferax lithotrophicus TaxID=2798804 RepID=A0ABM7MGX2_9BURK|nr:hypothetical protein [Rhodoferax sp. MIZ03]BCO25457.1 hypothetical protein MIZ03_0317 [Rhodoferax sp. MIZ03]